MSLVLLLSCRTDVKARPTDSSLLSVHEVEDTSRKIAQATEEQNGQGQLQRETELEDTFSSGMPLTRHRVTRSQEDLLTADAAGFTQTVFPKRVKKNNCIRRFRYQIIYNYFFAIPVCKKHSGCIEVKQIVNFPKGRTLAITYNCSAS